MKGTTVNNYTVAASSILIASLTTALYLKKKFTKEIDNLIAEASVDRSRVFHETYTSAYKDGERAAVMEYAVDKYNDLIEAQNKR